MLNSEESFLKGIHLRVDQLIGLSVVSADLKQPATGRQVRVL
jgi:hypothetical protein